MGVKPRGAKKVKKRTEDKWKTEEEKRCDERKNTIGREELKKVKQRRT